MDAVLHAVEDSARLDRKGRAALVFFTPGAYKKLPAFNRLRGSIFSLEDAVEVDTSIVRYPGSRFALIPTKQRIEVRVFWFFRWEAVLHGFKVVDRNLNTFWSVVSDGEEIDPFLLTGWTPS